MPFLRTGLAAIVSLLLSFSAFFVLQWLITRNIDHSLGMIMTSAIDFTRLTRDTETETRKRVLPAKQKPLESPPMPGLKLSRSFVAARSDAPSIDVPSVDINIDIGGDINYGLQATDAERVPIVRVAPQYPMRAQDRGIEGWVLVEFTITTNGSVRDEVVIEGDPPRIFDSAALRAVKKWKYRPEIVDGVAVEVKNRTKIEFELEEE